MKSNLAKKSSIKPAKSLKYLFQKPITFRFPFETRDSAPRYRGFHLNDWEKCTGCGNCADICPTQAIEMLEIKDLEVEAGNKPERPQIDYGRCCYCGLCVDICPPGALKLSRDYLHIDHGTESFVYLPKDEKQDKEHFVPKDKYSIFQANLNHRMANHEGFVSDLDFVLFDPERTPMDIESTEIRINSFIEEVKGYTAEKAKEESQRCLECKLCEDVCPAHMKISDYINFIYEGNLDGSAKEIYTDNPLPGVCGRICTHKCETACSLGKRGEPVSIRWLKRYAVDNVDVKKIEDIIHVFASSKKQKRIAIIGSGPSGLSAAYYLSLMGYKITIYEAKPMTGGIMRYGIPKYRLPHEAIDKDIEIIKNMGVVINTNISVGKDISLTEVKTNADAVFIGTGFIKGRSTGVSGIDSEGCFQAIPLLEKISSGKDFWVGRDIVVIGGGNVAFDIARSLARVQKQKYNDVKITLTCLEKRDVMLADEEEIIEGQEEGIIVKPGRGPKEVLFDSKGKVRGLKTVQCIKIFDDEGRFNPRFDENDVEEYNGEMIVEAIGQSPDYSYLNEEIMKQLKIVRGKINTDEYGRTSVPWLFAGGDIVHGPDVIHAIADGHRSAQAIDTYLMGRK